MGIQDLIVSENYELIEEIGEGAYGLIFKANQLSTGQVVAIKTLKIPKSLKEQNLKQQVARFERETQLCAQINHPNIVKLLDKGAAPTGEPYAVFEFVKGETLKTHILRGAFLSPSDMGDLMRQILEALAYVHQKGIIHRDLKPHNIMVVENQTRKYGKVLDFGIGAFAKESSLYDNKQLTMTHELLGTPTYSAPEQLRGEPPTIKSDLYAWGLIVIECLTGSPVMNGLSVAEVFQQQLATTNVPIPPVVLDHPLGGLLKRVLEKNPAIRLGDANLALKEFEQINFNTLTGVKRGMPVELDTIVENTLISDISVNFSNRTQKQLTILCLKLNLTARTEKYIDLNILDTIQKDLLNQCRDTATRYGAWVSEPFMNNLAIYFGYPESNDSDTRRAGRTALELFTGMKKRGALLQQQYGLDLNLQMGLHSGLVLVQRNQQPQGNVPNIAFDLVYKATAGSVLVSASSKKLLEPYLEFEKAEKNQWLSRERTYKLVGERRTEALFYSKFGSIAKSMVGRDIEKAHIISRWNKAPKEGSAVIVYGQAGIGKSRLIHELKQEVLLQQRKVSECRCLPEHQNNALYPFLKMLRDHWGISQLEDKALVLENMKKALSEVDCPIDEALPLLCSWLSIPFSGEFTLRQITPDEQKKILFNTLKNSILQIDNEQTFLLVVEDLHWIDSTSIEFLEYLLADIKQQSYMLLMTTRPEFKTQWESESLNRINLNSLGQGAIKRMVQEHLGSNQIDSSVLSYIEERADGIPFFIEELTNMLVEQEYIILTKSGFGFSEGADLKKIPETTQDFLNAKLDRLNLAKETAQLAAAIGREFPYDLLVQSSIKDEASTQSELDILIRSEVIYQQRGIQSNHYFFRHALIRDAAYNSMLPHFRKETHANIADALTDSFPRRVEENAFELAQHLAGADRFSEAIDFGLKHIKELVAKAQFHEALAIIIEIKKWGENVGNNQDAYIFNLKINEQLLPIYLNTDGFGTSKFVSIYEENKNIINYFKNNDLDDLASTFENVVLKGECLYLTHLNISNQRKKAREFGEPLLQKLEGYTDFDASKLRMMVKAVWGQMNMFEGYYDQAQESLTQVLKEGEMNNDITMFHQFGFHPITSAYGTLACLYAIRGEFAKAMSHLEKGLAYAVRMNNPVDIIVQYIYKSLLPSLYNREAEAKEALNDFNSTYGSIRSSSAYSPLLVFMEDWAYEKVDNSTAVRKAFVDAKQDAFLTWYELLLVDTLMKKKRFTDAFAIMEEVERRNVTNNETCLLPWVYDYLGSSLYHIEKEVTDDVKNYFSKGIALAQKQGNEWMELHLEYGYAKVLEHSGERDGFLKKQELMPKLKVDLRIR